MTPRFGRGAGNGDDTLVAATVDMMASTLGLRAGGLGEHAERVVELVRAVGERLGLEDRELRELAYAARLHDVGKAGVPSSVLAVAGPLGDEERRLLEGETVWGATLIGQVPGLGGVARIVRHQHERYDGLGYPDGLAGRDVPLAARILSVADAYVSMNEDRPYRRARPRFEVDHQFREGAGWQFDPYVVEALRAVVGASED